MPSAAWYKNLVYSLAEGLVVTDAQGCIAFFSRGAEQLTGWTGDQAAGQPLNRILGLADTNSRQWIDSILLAGGRHRVDLTTPDGRRITLAVTGARLAGGEQQTALVLCDITEEEAEHHLLSYFLANISHEFRTPLAGLIASIELLQDEAGHLSPAEIAELLNSIHRSASGLQALVDNLLESANIEAGHFAVHPRPIQLNQVIAEAIRVMQPLLDRRRQSLTLAVPFFLPPLSADPTRLAQVLINLLSNASKYSPQGKIIDLRVDRVEDQVRIGVADRGPGIPPAGRADLFRRFVRLDPSGSDQHGTGLGLAVVKAIVEGHGGAVGVDEQPGGGSIFWFTLPLAGRVNG